jgi:hypothetical protein
MDLLGHAKAIKTANHKIRLNLRTLIFKIHLFEQYYMQYYHVLLSSTTLK